MVLPLPLSPTKAVIDGVIADGEGEVFDGRHPPPPQASAKILVSARASSRADIILRRGLHRPLGRRRLVKVTGDEVTGSDLAKGRA